MVDEICKVAIHLKMMLTTKEAAEYSNIGINKIDTELSVCPLCRYEEARKTQRV